MFFVGTSGGPGRGLLAALLLTGVILLGVFLTFGVSRLLSGTLLRGVPSSFTLELPPYRRPRIGQVVVRSVLDRTLFVLGRAAAVAAPAGLLIWLCANVQVGGDSILNWCTGFLDPFARLLGLDGVILMAFLLGFPANEIVIPIIIMAYLSTGSLLEFDSLDALRQLLVDHGWTWLTAVCTMLFSLMHWPCSTTCLTIGKETKSAKWTLLSILPQGVLDALGPAGRLGGLGGGLGGLPQRGCGRRRAGGQRDQGEGQGPGGEQGTDSFHVQFLLFAWFQENHTPSTKWKVKHLF